VNNPPRLRLADVIRRRRTTLSALIKEIGLTTYQGLEIWCGRMGISAPTLEEFHVAVPATVPRVSSPQEGVIVLEPPPVIDEHTGRQIDPDAPVTPGVEVVTGPVMKNALVQLSGSLSGSLEEPTKSAQKKQKQKKDDQSDPV
jgi:hypothetical protein